MKNHNRENRKVRRLLVFAAIVVVVCALLSWNGRETEESVSTEEKPQTVEEKDLPWAEEKEGLTEEEQRARLEEIKAEAGEMGVPERVISLIDQNDETVDFVRDYPDKHLDDPADSIGTDWDGTGIPGLIQWDERWGYMSYGSGTGTIANCGCGPACVSMVIIGLTGDRSVTPYVAARYSEEHGLIDENDNTYWQFLADMPQEYGIEVQEGMLGEEQAAQELAAGNPIICSVGPGDFTDEGHFIVLAGYENGEVLVHDPFSQANSDRRWVYTEIAEQIEEMWLYKIPK